MSGVYQFMLISFNRKMPSTRLVSMIGFYLITYRIVNGEMDVSFKFCYRTSLKNPVSYKIQPNNELQELSKFLSQLTRMPRSWPGLCERVEKTPRFM